MAHEQVKAGEPAPKSGKYREQDSGNEVELKEGEVAPPSSTGGSGTYILIKENE